MFSLLVASVPFVAASVDPRALAGLARAYPQLDAVQLQEVAETANRQGWLHPDWLKAGNVQKVTDTAFQIGRDSTKDAFKIADHTLGTIYDRLGGADHAWGKGLQTARDATAHAGGVAQQGISTGQRWTDDRLKEWGNVYGKAVEADIVQARMPEPSRHLSDVQQISDRAFKDALEISDAGYGAADDLLARIEARLAEKFGADNRLGKGIEVARGAVADGRKINDLHLQDGQKVVNYGIDTLQEIRDKAAERLKAKIDELKAKYGKGGNKPADAEVMMVEALPAPDKMISWAQVQSLPEQVEKVADHTIQKGRQEAQRGFGIVAQLLSTIADGLEKIQPNGSLMQKVKAAQQFVGQVGTRVDNELEQANLIIDTRLDTIKNMINGNRQ